MKNIKISERKISKIIILNVVIITSILSILITSFFLYNYYFIIRPHIYYIIEYDVKVSEESELINNVEQLNYSKYLNCSETGMTKCYVDLNYYKNRINGDTSFHINPNYYHFFEYLFKAENSSEIYLTYNNNSLFSIKNSNNSNLFPVYENVLYLNFSIIPYVYNESATLLLKDITIVKIDFTYIYSGKEFAVSTGFNIVQYVILEKNFDVILICISDLLIFY